MKRIFFIALIAVFMGFISCEKKNGPDVPMVENDSLTMGAGYTNDIFYSFTNGMISLAPRTNWDIAFSVDPQSSAILINEGAGVELKVYPTDGGWSWGDAIDTTGLADRTALYNPDDTWDDGAFGMNATGHPNYGWGVYNTISHNIEGVALYIIKLRNGDYKQIFIEIKQSTLQSYTFKFADIAGTNEQVIDLDLSASTANFVYYSLEDALRVDREPDKSSWDILLTKWVDNSIAYPVTGVLLNNDIQAIEADDTYLESVVWTEENFSDDISVIGYDWKSFNMDTFMYEVDINRVYLVRDMLLNVYALSFTSFDYTIGKFVFSTLKK